MAEVVVRGYTELQRALRVADKETRLGVRRELREVAEPVRRDAESLARSAIPRNTVRWSKMRTGVTTTVVYVAPRQRGVKGRGDNLRRRPEFGTLLMGRAMEPALDRHAPDLERAVDQMLGRMADRFNRGF